MSRQRGFTLLELVAALAIFALMSVMAYGGLSALLRTSEGLDESYQRLNDWQGAVHRMRLDLDQVRDRPIRDEFGDIQPAFYSPESGRIEFTHGGKRNPLLLPRSSLERVGYFLDTDGRLMRLSWLNLDRGQSEEPLRLPLLNDVETLEWRFLQDNDEWAETWPPLSFDGTGGGAVPMPRAVEALIGTRRLGELRLLFYLREPA